jgi:hypothetical protein
VRSRVYSKLGLLLVVTSCLLWAAILAVPILTTSVAQKSLIAVNLVIISEALFWVGILLTGKELAHRFRHQLNPFYWWQQVTHRR